MSTLTFSVTVKPTLVVVDHVQAGLDRLCQYIKDKPNHTALMSIFLARYNMIEAMFFDLLTLRSIYTANIADPTGTTGSQLDQVGRLVGQSRNGMTNDDYRRYCFAADRTNRSNGLVEDLIQIAKLVLNDDTAYIQVDQQGTAALVIRILTTTLDDPLANVLLDFMQRGALAGVRVIVETQYDPDPLTFMTATAAFVTSPVTGGDTYITVDSTIGFPVSGSIDVDTALAVSETITYTGMTATSFTGCSAAAHAHVNGTCVTLSGSPGAGCGDTSDPTAGGELASARDISYP